MNKLIQRFGNWIKDIDPETYVSDKQRIAELEAMNQRLLKLKAAVKELPVEEWVEQQYDGQPYLVGYVMQAQGEWDAVRQALAALEGEE